MLVEVNDIAIIFMDEAGYGAYDPGLIRTIYKNGSFQLNLN